MTARIIDGFLTDALFLDEPRLRRVMLALNGDGEETRIVGGAVRNALMGEPVHEVDLATTALPEVTIARAKAAGFKTIPTGIEHGTITLVVDGTPFEATTLREDVETHGRHATVRFGRDFRMDALRRDFTINQMSVDAHGRLHDYAGGVQDVAARRVRFIGDAAARIAEDYLRILRFFRFHATYGQGEMNADALHASIAARGFLDSLSRERVRAELLKLLAARRARDVVETMVHASILGPVLGGAPNPDRLARLKSIEAEYDLAPDPVLNLAALAVQTREDAERLRERLRLSNAEQSRLENAANALAPLHCCEAPPDAARLRRLLYVHGRQSLLDALALAHAESRASSDDSRWRAAFSFVCDHAELKMPFAGADLLAQGFVRGPAVGAALSQLETAWMDSDFPSEPEVLEKMLTGVAKGAL